MHRDHPRVPAVDGAALATWFEDPLWYKDAVVYEVHVRAFYDSNNDGIGDLPGLIQKLDYIQDLGVNTIWLLPFYPSPMRDDGYDIADYHNVHPQYGTRNDVRILVREAHRRGLKIITELVINHSSDQHAWFQAARRAAPGTAKRDYYVWSDTPSKYAGTRVIFSDTETSNWAWDDVAKAYYWHRFFSHQPDLNFDSPGVLQAVKRVMRFWLDMGVDGLRLDAIPYLVEREDTSNENLPETHAVIKEIRREIDTHYRGRMLLAEANQWPEDVRDYFGDGDECHMAYHFPLMPRMYMAIAQEDRHPIVEIMQQTPDIPDPCQWAIFLRNHDELTLEMVTSRERDYMYKMYAADPRSRVNLGIRRRLAPLMDNDIDRIRLMNSLLLSMPGTPIIYYGDEIGMGDNIFLGDRNGVRTPMQWGPDRNAGFSRCDPQRLYLPPIMDAIYGYEAVNVEAQAREPSSLLNWMKRLLVVRRGGKAFGRGGLRFLAPGNRKVLAYLREYQGEAMLCVANLSRSAQAVELDLAHYKGRVPVELMGRTPFPPVGDLPYLLTLPGYAFYWFELAVDAEVPAWHEERLPREELPMLVLFDGWSTFFRDRVVPWRIAMAEKARAQLEQDTLPRFIAAQRWYAGKGQAVTRAAMVDHVMLESGPTSWLLALFNVEAGAEQAHYSMPLALAWEDVGEERLKGMLPATLARVRQQAKIGVLADAYADEAFCRALLELIGAGRVLPSAKGSVRFMPTGVFSELGPDLGQLPITPSRAQSSNTTLSFGQRLFLKGYRRLRPGVSPELEIGRFLTEVAHFPHCVPLAGAVEYLAADGTHMTLALLQAYVENQGDAWNYTVDYLDRFLEQLGAASAPLPEDAHGAYLPLIHTLGLRTAELHKALALVSGDPAFDPEPVQARDLEAWKRNALVELASALTQLEQQRSGLVQALRSDALALLEQRAELERRIELSVPAQLASVKTRLHGDYHLGQVLLRNGDFVIIDFEGEPARTLDERRQKHSPLRDVAGMLRSFNYARHTAVGRAAERRPQELDRFAQLSAQWEKQVRTAFLRSYEEAMQSQMPADSIEPARRLLELFELEKAFYELRYELGNRPDWVGIPLRGLLALVRGK